MKLFNATRMVAGCTLGVPPDGREWIVVVAKGTFAIPAPGAEPALAPAQAPLVDADTFTGEPGFSSTVYECDYALRKPACDVLLNGSAHAPGGVPAARVTVGLSVGPVRKAFDVVGHRAWVKGLLGVTPTPPVPFTKLPISYDAAFGGIDRTREPETYYPLNHAGRGFHAADGAPLPNTQESGADIESPRGRYRPMAFGPVGRSWEPRRRFAGTYDQKWLDEVSPFLPADFRDEYYQAAPADQQMPHPRGGEEVTLLNLTPAGHASFRLPAAELPVTVSLHRGAHAMRAVVDTVVIEPDLGRFTMTWRAAAPLPRSMHDVAEVVVGEPSRAWKRARATNKTYYPSLAGAIRDRGLRPRPTEVAP